MIQLIFRTLALLPDGLRRRLVRLLMDLVWRVYLRERVVGRELVPEGPVLFICNHLSNADGYCLVRAFRPRRVWFLAGVKLKTTTMTRLAMEVVDTIPIKPNSADLDAIRKAVEMLRGGQSVLIFPEGGRSRTGGLIRAKKGVTLIANRAGVPVVPVAVTGTERFLPINDADMGGEQVRRGVDVTIRFGRPFRVEELTPAPGVDDPRQALADAMMERIAELLPPDYRGVYGSEKESLETPTK